MFNSLSEIADIDDIFPPSRPDQDTPLEPYRTPGVSFSPLSNLPAPPPDDDDSDDGATMNSTTSPHSRRRPPRRGGSDTGSERPPLFRPLPKTPDDADDDVFASPSNPDPTSIRCEDSPDDQIGVVDDDPELPVTPTETGSKEGDDLFPSSDETVRPTSVRLTHVVLRDPVAYCSPGADLAEPSPPPADADAHEPVVSNWFRTVRGISRVGGAGSTSSSATPIYPNEDSPPTYVSPPPSMSSSSVDDSHHGGGSPSGGGAEGGRVGELNDFAMSFRYYPGMRGGPGGRGGGASSSGWRGRSAVVSYDDDDAQHYPPLPPSVAAAAAPAAAPSAPEEERQPPPPPRPNINPDSLLIALANANKTVTLVGALDGTPKYSPRSLPDTPDRTVQISPTYLACACFDSTIRLFDMTSSQRYVSAPILRGHTSWVRCVAFHPFGGGLLLSGSRDASVRMWTKTSEGRGRNPDNWATVCVLRGGHSESVREVRWESLGDPPEPIAFSASLDQTVVRWDLEKESNVAQSPKFGAPLYDLAVAEANSRGSNRLLAVAARGQGVRLLDSRFASGGRLYSSIAADTPDDHAWSVTFGPTSNSSDHLVVGSVKHLSHYDVRMLGRGVMYKQENVHTASVLKIAVFEDPFDSGNGASSFGFVSVSLDRWARGWRWSGEDQRPERAWQIEGQKQMYCASVFRM